MPLCQGRPDGPCPAGRNDPSVRGTQGDLMLCPDCDKFRFPPNYGVTRSAKSSKPAKQTVVEKTEKRLVVNELLAYIVYYRERCSRSALVKVISGFFSAAEISNAKKFLLSEFESLLSSTAFLTERRGSTARPAQEAELDDIIGALEHVDSANVLKNITFAAADLNRLPGYGPEDTNICTIVDKQQQLVSTVSQLSESVNQLHTASSDVNHVKEAVKASVESSLAPLQLKVTELSNLCTHIVESLKPSSTSHAKAKVDAGDSVDQVDRSRNVIIFGIDEATDN